MKRGVFSLVRILVGVSALALGAPACGGAGGSANDASALAGKKPGDVYTAYTAAIGNAVNIDELAPYLSRARRTSGPQDLEAVKAKVPGGVLKITAQEIQGDKATLTIEATIAAGGHEVPSVGTIVMVREDGAWKVDQETWKAK